MRGRTSARPIVGDLSERSLHPPNEKIFRRERKGVVINGAPFRFADAGAQQDCRAMRVEQAEVPNADGHACTKAPPLSGRASASRPPRRATGLQHCELYLRARARHCLARTLLQLEFKTGSERTRAMINNAQEKALRMVSLSMAQLLDCWQRYR